MAVGAQQAPRLEIATGREQPVGIAQRGGHGGERRLGVVVWQPGDGHVGSRAAPGADGHAWSRATRSMASLTKSASVTMPVR
jgi:hypothetical protein